MKTAINSSFDAFIGSLYADGTLPPVIVVDDILGANIRYVRTGSTPVERQDESADCPVFGNWRTYYEFVAWAEYMHGSFQRMVDEVLSRRAWCEETIAFITIIDGLINVQARYIEKYGHAPVDLHKFIKSYVKHGANTVLRRDIY